MREQIQGTVQCGRPGVADGQIETLEQDGKTLLSREFPLQTMVYRWVAFDVPGYFLRFAPE